MNVKIEYDRCNDKICVKTNADFRNGKCYIVGDGVDVTRFHAFCDCKQDIEAAISKVITLQDIDLEEVYPEFILDDIFIAECLPLMCELEINTECNCRCKNKQTLGGMK